MLEVVHGDAEEREVDGGDPCPGLRAVVASVAVVGSQQVSQNLDGLFPKLGVPGTGPSKKFWNGIGTITSMGDLEDINPLASEKIRTDSRIREIQALTPFN